MKTKKISLSKGLADYLEVLQLSGMDDYIRSSLELSFADPFQTIKETTPSGQNVSSGNLLQKKELQQELSLQTESEDNHSGKNVSSTNSLNSNDLSFADLNQKLENEPIETEMNCRKSRNNDSKDRTVLLDLLAQEVAKCQKCPALVESRSQTVFGTGNPYSELVFIGEGPGAEEDKQGLPFVGRSGQLLNDIIAKGMKLKREDIYICNIVRCRPKENRNPTSEEAKCCRPFLDATLEIIQPKYICCLGSIAATYLLHSDQTIGRLRGIVHDYQGAKVVCTYHPAYLLRNPPAKAQTWEDIKLLMKIMNLPVQ
ncbi:MAG: uracil-DNA glycosylase [Planctomycetia bacterium]|nr:uracil-DNA glycosylase [Planctomycetia bacterium]